MNYFVIVDVTLREGIADPEGATIEKALPALGFSGVSDVKAGKSFRMSIDAESEDEERHAAEPRNGLIGEAQKPRRIGEIEQGHRQLPIQTGS